MADKDILEFVQSSGNIIDEDSLYEHVMNNAAPDLTPCEMRNNMKTAGWVAWLVCRWRSAPKVVVSTAVQVGGFSRYRKCRMNIRHVKDP
ncbi:hypothetical protein TNCV_3661021 [Trichonephila clavipes]|nr:hypothetical protein TNCV_3661021 [Trichonephila clavipes]